MITLFRLFSITVASLVGAEVAAGSVAAQSAQSEAMLACDQIKDDDARLICFNAVVAALKASGGRGRTTTVDSFDRSNAPAQRRIDDASDAAQAATDAQEGPDFSGRGDDNFGRSLTDIAPKTPDQLTAGLARWQENVEGKIRFELDNGQVWEETTASGMFIPRSARSVEIKKSLFGGYRIFVDGANRDGRVRRVQ